MAKRKVKQSADCNCSGNCHCWHGKSGSGIYGLGFIGALIYYISTAPTFWAGLLGIVKAIFWPGFLVYGALKFLGA